MFLGSFQTMIKRHLHFMMNFAMIFLMAFFLLIYLLVNNSNYLAISNGQTEDISRLVCNMMNTELNTLLNQPQSIALSMANDSLIKNTLKEEPANLDFQQAVIAADHAMYDSKNNGKKCLTWYEAEK